MNRCVWRSVFSALLAIAASITPAFAQGSGSTSLSGVVSDAGGGVIPGATVVVKNNATSVTFEATTNTSGAFSVPALDPGTYTVTVSLAGFKTAVINDIRLLTATPASIQARLEVGDLSETIEVKGGSTLVQTQSAAVTSTIAVEQLKELPLVSRNGLYALAFLPGVETSAGPRGATISGLPNNTVNITIDGISTGNALMSTDGFFSMVTPRLDAVEEITVTGATPGAGGGGAGAVQIAFTTRSGTNEFNSSLYHYFRHPSFNSNYYFNKINNLDKNEVIVHQYGGRVGGPVVIPGLFNGRNKAFFFFNMEHQYQPSEATRTRTILNPAAEQGIFSYVSGGVTRQVNLLELAARGNQTSTPDPTVARVLAAIRAATGTTGTVSTPVNATNTQQYVYQSSSDGNQYAPTGRLDFNLTDNHRLTGTYYWQRFLAKPDLLNNVDPQFPGFDHQGFQTSYRTTGSVGMRSTLSSTMVNEVKTGWQWSPNNFYGNITPEMFDLQGGNALTFDFGQGSGLRLTSAGSQNNPAPRNTVNWSVDNTLSWLKGAHSLSMGGGFAQITHNQDSWNAVPGITFGVDQNNDPANSLFNTTNFPGASTTTLADARNLYALITGRVTAVTGTARLDADTGKYVYLGSLRQRSRLNAFNLFAQDSWRVTPTVTVNAGVRWDLQLPFVGLTNTWSTATLADLCGVSGVGSGPDGRSCNMFQPGNLAGGAGFVPTFKEFGPGDKAFRTDWNNFGPNVGIAWRPDVQGGWLRPVLGDPEQATLRAGYSMTHGLERMDRFTTLYGGNPGGSVAAARNYTTGFPLLGPGETAPVLLRERNRLGPPAFPDSPAYPIQAVASNNVNIFDENIRTPYVHSYSAGFQRSLGRDMAVEIRYVGNRNMNAWTTENWNERVIFENGFIDEFKLAQRNLAANIAAGRGANFRYAGAGTGTSPLPTYLAYFSGVAASRASDPAAYSSANFANSAWTGHLGFFEPDPVDAANDLHANTTFRTNAINAGLASNFFVMNPAVTQANITQSLAGTRYHSMQVDLRRRLSRGLLIAANYTYSTSTGSQLETLRRDRVYLDNTDVPHSFKMQWTYEIPVGRGRRFGRTMNPWLDAVLGNWEYSGTGRVQTNRFEVDDAKLFGMTQDELQKAFKIHTVRTDTGAITVFSFPQDIVDNTRRAYNTDPTSPTGYPAGETPAGRYIGPASTAECIFIYVGDCGAPEQILLNGPLFTRFDMRLKKRFPFGRKANVEVDVEVLNVFDNINYNHQFNPGATSNQLQVTTAYTDINTTFDPGGRIGQLVWRINW
jgi:hypothetical protein